MNTLILMLGLLTTTSQARGDERLRYTAPFEIARINMRHLFDRMRSAAGLGEREVLLGLYYPGNEPADARLFEEGGQKIVQLSAGIVELAYKGEPDVAAMAHLLGHVVQDKLGAPRDEAQADNFAAALVWRLGMDKERLEKSREALRLALSHRPRDPKTECFAEAR